MKLIEPKISIFVNENETTIELFDSSSFTCFAKVTLTATQFCQALSRLSRTDCEVVVDNLDKIGKKLEHREFVFETMQQGRDKKPSLATECAMSMNSEGLIDNGWIADNYYGSQNSFFQRDGKYFARTTIRRYI